jgi:hypothetical protein
LASGGYQHVSCGHNLPGGEAKRVRILEYRARLDDAHAGLLDIRGVDTLQPGDLLVLVGNQGGPVESRRWDGPSEPCGILDFVMDVRRVDQKLLRHAAPDHAGPAKPEFLGDRHAGAIARGNSGGAHAARSPANDEQIDVEISHISPLA